MLISGYENYEIKEDGSVINNRTGRVLKQEKIWDGYMRVSLSKDGVVKRFRVHRLVASHFIPNSDPYKDQVNHKDGDRSNNHVDNLEWVSCKENINHGRKSFGEAHYSAKLTEESVRIICDLIQQGLTRGRVLKRVLGVSKYQFDDIRSRKSWKHISCKYQW